MYLAPGDPENFLVQGRTVSPDVLASIREQYSLDDPYLVRFWNWLTGVLHGDFGQSLANRQDVGELLAARLPTTLTLVLLAGFIIVVVGIGFGIIAGTRDGPIDKLVVLGSNVGFAVPTFFAALTLMSIFRRGTRLVSRLWLRRRLLRQDLAPDIAVACPGSALGGSRRPHHPHLDPGGARF